MVDASPRNSPVRDAGTGVSAATHDDDRVLCARLLQRDPTATADLACTHLDGVARALQRAFPTADPHLAQSVAIDLILSLAERPEQYKPERSGLAAYLRMAARRDMLNALKREQRRTRRQMALEQVELAQETGNSAGAAPGDPLHVALRAEELDEELLARLRMSLSDLEWKVVQLMMEGERRTSRYAALLGLDGQPLTEQARDVKRVKDRLLKRLRRLAPRMPRHA